MNIRLPNAHGYIDLIDVVDGRLLIAGWMIHPLIAMDSFKVFVDDKIEHEALFTESNGVGEVYPFVKHASRSVFHASIHYDTKPGLRNIDIVGYADGKETAKLETCFSEELRPDFAFPDVLKVRVANNANKAYFSASSFTSFRNYFEQVQRFTNPGSVSKMLDWGCGCGRLTVMFSRGASIPNVYGCDIDGESIAWCRENLTGNFDVVPLLPPTNYKDAFFDLVISNSVFTHLTKDIQRKWLEEIHRITVPGGLFLASVHGEFATFLNFRGEVDQTLKDEINDGMPDNNLQGVIPEGYYRGTYQKRAYTERVFGNYFEVLDYIEAGASHFQDLVVMRRATE